MGRSRRLRRHRGILETERRSSWWQHWRESYLQALAMSWPVFLALVAFAYGAINALYAVLYRLDPSGIAGVRAAGLSWADAFFFSVQTLGSIGYGAMHPISLYTNLVVTVEALCGLLFIALTTGLAFARFARSTARIRFSQLAVVHAYNGVPTLVFRLVNERRNGLLDARLRAFQLIWSECTGSMPAARCAAWMGRRCSASTPSWWWPSPGWMKRWSALCMPATAGLWNGSPLGVASKTCSSIRPMRPTSIGNHSIAPAPVRSLPRSEATWRGDQGDAVGVTPGGTQGSMGCMNGDACDALLCCWAAFWPCLCRPMRG